MYMSVQQLYMLERTKYNTRSTLAVYTVGGRSQRPLPSVSEDLDESHTSARIDHHGDVHHIMDLWYVYKYQQVQ